MDIFDYQHSATQHGMDSSEPDHEVGDLQAYLASMWELLTDEQKSLFHTLKAVRETYAAAIGADISELCPTCNFHLGEEMESCPQCGPYIPF